MHTVTMQTDVVDLREQMNAMREWLDDLRCELSAFNCRHSDAGVLLVCRFHFGCGCESVRNPLRRRIDCELTFVSKRGSFGPHSMLPVIGSLRSSASNMPD
jgi:hypothetical protein